jgi:phage head maturation protease
MLVSPTNCENTVRLLINHEQAVAAGVQRKSWLRNKMHDLSVGETFIQPTGNVVSPC